MRKLFLILLLSLPAFAQHSALLKWPADSDAAANPSLTYNVYKAAQACPATGPTITGQAPFSKVASTAAGVLSYTDPNLQIGAIVCYYVTAVVNTVESVPSGAAGGQIGPAPVTGFTCSAQ